MPNGSRGASLEPKDVQDLERASEDLSSSMPLVRPSSAWDNFGVPCPTSRL